MVVCLQGKDINGYIQKVFSAFCFSAGKGYDSCFRLQTLALIEPGAEEITRKIAASSDAQ